MKGSFSISIIFLVLSIIGLALLPQLSVQLRPSHKSEQVHVSYKWNSIAAEVLEKEVTAPLEGALASVQGVKDISSVSKRGSGNISLTFKEGVDIDAARFEVSSLIRSIYKRLPEGLSRPSVAFRKGGADDENPLLLVYYINGEGSKKQLQDYAEENIVNTIGQIPGISTAVAVGALPTQWEVSYDANKLLSLGLTMQDIRKAITRHLYNGELGTSLNDKGQTLFLSYKCQAGDSLIWSEIIVGKREGRVIHLTDVAQVRKHAMQAKNYYRVNGLNTIYLVVYSENGTNQIQLAKELTAQMDILRESFPNNFSVTEAYNAAEKLEEEVSKISLRASLAVGILLVFVLLVSRRWRYLLIIMLSLLANLSISLFLYYLFGVEIHLYSLAGITVSMGIIIDNTIVMVDHLRHAKNKKAFLAILAATLTTIGSLSIIFFLKEQQRMNLEDFAFVMLINLVVSLFVALWLIPALTHLIPLQNNKPPKAGKTFRKHRRKWKRAQRYLRFVLFTKRWRWAFLIVIAWAFGLPLYLIPAEISVNEKKGEKETWWTKSFNTVLGNETYVSDVRPWVNRILGGSLYYFNSYMGSGSMRWDDQETVLTVTISMPDGSTIEQMNEVVLDWENYLASFEGIEKFVADVRSIDKSTIRVHFTEEAEWNGFTYDLKQALETKATETGSADFGIYGVGRGFNNALREGRKNCKIELKGYNFDQLKLFANSIKDSLQKHSRVKEIVIQTGRVWRGKPRYEFVMDMDMEQLAANNSSMANVFNNLKFYSPQETYAGYDYANGEPLPIYVRKQGEEAISIWDFKNNLLRAQKDFLRLKQVGTIAKERTGSLIRKKNQQYTLDVEYDFVGSFALADRVLERQVERIAKELPLGYSVRDARRNGGWWNKKEETQYWLLLLVVGIIYFICAILLESLWQPLVVIATIPVAFIGVFLTFAVFKLNFDQGGYASMILLCGITVNSALYIINDFNNNQRDFPARRKINHYLKAFNHKVTPILLTILSTVLGMFPFLIDGKEGGFWFSLACGSMGGLLFSVLAIFIWLPLFMKLKVRGL